jgi:hypothetical protein
MRTPAGKECRYFYGNYYRGRSNEECRLLSAANPPLTWRPAMCTTCPVPGIMLANACPSMVLEPRLVRPLKIKKQQVAVKTFCTKTQRSGFDPHIGCGECHGLAVIFEEGPGDPTPAGS